MTATESIAILVAIEKLILKICWCFGKPGIDIAAISVETDSYERGCACIIAVGNGVLLIVYLLHRFLRRAAEFELEDVDVFLGFYHRIETPGVGVDLCLNHGADQLEYGEEYGLVVLFVLQRDCVGDVEEKRLEIFGHRIDVELL